MAMAAAPGLDYAQLEALYTSDPDRLAQLQSIVGFVSQRGQGNLFLSVPTVDGRPLDLVRLLEKVRNLNATCICAAYICAHNDSH